MKRIHKTKLLVLLPLLLTGCSLSSLDSFLSELVGDSSSEATSEVTSETTSEATSETTSETTSEGTSEITSEITSEATSEVTSEATSETTSETTSEQTSEASSEASSSVTSEASSSLESSSEVASSTTVFFQTSGSSVLSGDLASSKYETTEDFNLGSISCSFCTNQRDGSICVGTSTSSGAFTVTFGQNYVVKSVTIHATRYSSSSASGLTVTTPGHGRSQTVDITSEAYYEFNDFANDYLGSASVTIANSSRGRVKIYDVSFELEEPEPIYPSDISLDSDFSIAVNRTRTLKVTYSPSETTVKNVTFSSNNNSVATVDNDGVVTGVSIGEADITATAQAETGFVTATTHVTITAQPVLEKTEMAYSYKDLGEASYFCTTCPSEGEAKLLVIPVWFNDSSNFINTSNKATVRSDIEKAYFGTKAETGWHSVKTYYEEESMGRLTITGTVSSWYSVNESYTAYGPERSGGNKTMSLVNTAADWYFQTTGESRLDYDKDGDGLLDGVLLIYAAPDYYSSNTSSYSNLWAYCYWVQDESYKNVNNPGANVFFWASYDFMYDSSTARTRTGKSSYGAGDNDHCDPDAHTFIHEMGHVFGLDDYYDYGSSGYSPARGFSMQDWNVGGHDAFSTVALGWTDPYIPTESCTITLNPFQSSHDAILLTPSWNDYDSPFDEYLLLELFTPTGLNKMDCDYAYATNDAGPSATGIRLWHVDARLAYYTRTSFSGEPSWSASQLTTRPDDPNIMGCEVAFVNTYNDSDYGSVLGSSYDKYNLLELISASTSARTPSSSYLSASDLFRNNSSFSMSKYAAQFANSGKLNSNLDLGWSFSVSINGSGANATAIVDLTRA